MPKRRPDQPKTATVDKWGIVRFANSVEELDISEENVVMSPKGVNNALKADGYLQYADVVLTATEIKALETTPQTLVAAQGEGKIIKFMGAVLKLNYGSEVFAESGDNLQIKYTDDSGVEVSQVIETTGFIDQSADTYTSAEPKIDVIAAASAAENAPLVIDNIGSAITGNASDDSTVSVRVFYQVMSI